MNFFQIYLIVGLIILGLMTALWFLSLLIKNASIVDIFWGSGFVLSAWTYYVMTPDGFEVRKWLLVILTTIWGLRLSSYILWRNFGKEEDFRYQVWRKEAGENWWWRSFFKVFLLQGFLMWLISIPLLAAQHSSQPDRIIWLDYLAVLAWAFGFYFEAVGDFQLARFKANPANKGKLLSSGVWRYTRHPHYFGDALQWWAYFLFASATGAYWTIFSPIIMTVLLRRVSGVTLLEKSLSNSKPGYKEYVETTNAFVPWFPKRRV